MTELTCKIVRSYWPQGFQHACYDYEVYDGSGEVVAVGTSSSPDWVKHDAGGYHTKVNFNERYPEGWSVSFDF